MTTDTQAIRERAERLIELAGKATPGEWHLNVHDEDSEYYGNLWSELGEIDGHNYIRTIALMLKYADRDERKANANFVVAVNPVAVTALARDLLAALDREKVLEAEVARLATKSNAEMLRVKACEHIAEQDEGWEKLRNECPSTAAVASVVDRLIAAEAQLATLRQQIAAEELYRKIKTQIERGEFQYRVEESPEGFEPQMLYTLGRLDGFAWFPLTANGYWSDPDAFTDGEIKIRSFFPSRDEADRAIVCARRVNGEKLIRAAFPASAPKGEK